MKVGKVILNLTGISILAGTIYFAKKAIDKSHEMVSRYRGYYDVTKQWLKIKNEDKSTVEYFNDNDYSNIAIYGLGELGSRLYEELKNSNINVKYFVDKEADSMYFGEDDIELASIHDLDDNGIDVIVITPVYAYEDIEKQLLDKGISCDIVSIEDVVYEL